MAEQATMHVVVASVGETRYEGRVVSLTVPGEAGDMTILPHHEALVTTLKPGKVTVRPNPAEARDFDIVGGVLEVSGNRAVVLL